MSIRKEPDSEPLQPVNRSWDHRETKGDGEAQCLAQKDGRPDVSATEEHERHLSGQEVVRGRRRAKSGAAIDAMRGSGIRVR